jgi:hypothetical protein
MTIKYLWDQEYPGSRSTGSTNTHSNGSMRKRLNANSNSFQQSLVDSEAPTFQIGKVQMNKMNKLTVWRLIHAATRRHETNMREKAGNGRLVHVFVFRCRFYRRDRGSAALTQAPGPRGNVTTVQHWRDRNHIA